MKMLLPRLDQLRSCEDGPQNYAKAANNYVGNPEKRVSAAHDGPCRDQDGLCPIVQPNWEI